MLEGFFGEVRGVGEGRGVGRIVGGGKGCWKDF